MNKLSAAAIAASFLALTACNGADTWFWDKHGSTSATDPGSPTLVFNADDSATLTFGIGSISSTSQKKPLHVYGGVYYQLNDRKCISQAPLGEDDCHDKGAIQFNSSSVTIPATSMTSVAADLAYCTRQHCSGSVTVAFDNHDPSGSVHVWCNSETISWDEGYDGTPQTDEYLNIDQQTDQKPCPLAVPFLPN